ncbi:MAG: energy transducer TonB, partial [Deltaproteobacteria bacterium]|nr:energy transducer TonB [Deltaproteobacteria bacterium]
MPDADVPYLSHSVLEIRKQVAPAYPPAGRALGLPEVVCLANVLGGEDGVPLEVTVSKCLPEFEAATRDALLKWRWYPTLDEDGAPQKFMTTIRVTYKLPDAGTPLFDPEFAEGVLAVGALHAPADSVLLHPRATTVLFRVYGATGLDPIGVPVLALAAEMDVRGFETFAIHARGMAGPSAVIGDVKGLVGAGIGFSQRGTEGP